MYRILDDAVTSKKKIIKGEKEDLIFVCGVFSRQFELIKQAHQLYQVSNAMMLKGTHHRVLGMRTSSI